MDNKKFAIPLIAFFLAGILSSFYQVQAQELPESSVPPLSVKSELPIYSAGSTVKISGQIKTLNENYVQPVIIRILDSEGELVDIGQVEHNEEGRFAFQTTSGGTWKKSGEYKVLVNYGGQSAENTFVFSGAEDFVPPPPASSSRCGPNEVLVGGECIQKKPVEPPPLKCSPNEILVNGECIEKEPVEPPPQEIRCGPDEQLVGDRCVSTVEEQPDEGNGCLVATAAFGTELAPQVQVLREVRDTKLLNTELGTAFMTGFNQFYYTFSPTIADWERQNPVFKEAVKVLITPMILTLSVMDVVQDGSEGQVLGVGMTLIALNLGMYVFAPALVVRKVIRYLPIYNEEDKSQSLQKPRTKHQTL